MSEMADTNEKPKSDFSVDYEEDSNTTVLYTLREDRYLSLRVRVIRGEPLPNVDVDGEPVWEALGEETSIVYGLVAPSLDRVRAGWSGPAADDVIECTIADATVEDVIAALQWVIGERPTPRRTK